MRQTQRIPVLTRPLNVSSAIKIANANQDNPEFGGALVQSLDMTNGTYSPNRKTVPTILELEVITYDSNSDLSGQVDWTDPANAVTWSVSIGGAAPTVITAQSTGDFTLDTSMRLVMRYNMPPSVQEVVVYAKGEFADSTSGNTATIDESVSLGVVNNSQHSLRLERSVPTVSVNGSSVPNGQYADRLTVINVPKLAVYEAGAAVPWKVDRTEEWQRRCRVQLYNGDAPLSDLHEDLSNEQNGVACYYWFVLGGDGSLSAIQEAAKPNWLLPSYEYNTGTGATTLWYPDGSMAKEIKVSFALRTNPIEDLRLVCRAAFIPYGTYSDYLLANSTKLDPNKIWQAGNWREIGFHLRIKWPELHGIDIADMSVPLLKKQDVGSSSVSVIRRALLQARGRTLIDPTVTAKPSAANNRSVAEKLYNINWKKIASNNTEVSIGTGEWLNVTASSIRDCSIVVDAEPKCSYNEIVPAN